MKLAWFTPAAIRSAIGRVSKLVVRELLAHGHQVVVVRSEDLPFLDAPAHAFGVEIVKWDDRDAVAALARDCDALLYSVGDNFQFHRGCLEWLPDRPGVVCLHDYFVGNLFNGWAQHDRAAALATLRLWYGPEIAAEYFSFKSCEELLERTHETAPLTEWIASLATAVITHSRWGIDRVLAACPGPIRVVPLAYDAPALRQSAPARVAEQFTVLTMGHVNSNKRAQSMICAIANSTRLRERTLYRLVGPSSPEMASKLTRLAQELGVRLSIAGEVDDETLRQSIQAADVISCLRFPSLEAASASTIEAMLYGKPVIVTDTGFYRDLPGDCVRKISPERELVDLQRELEFLCEEESERVAMGVRAAAWAQRTFSPANYAEKLVAVSLSAARAAPLLKASRFFAETLVGWGATDQGTSWLASKTQWK